MEDYLNSLDDGLDLARVLSFDTITNRIGARSATAPMLSSARATGSS